jgi:hypothetical protein
MRHSLRSIAVYPFFEDSASHCVPYDSSLVPTAGPEVADRVR